METSRKSIKPYVSKRKRTAERLENETTHKKPSVAEQGEIKCLFLTDETVLRYSESKRNFSPTCAIKSISVIPTPLWSVKWCPKFSHLIACTAENSLQLYDVMKRDVPYSVHTSKHHSGFLRDIDWSRTSRQIATCSFDKTVKICDYMNDAVISQTIELIKMPTVVRWVPDCDHTIIVGGHDSFLASFDLRSGKRILTYKSMCGNVIAIDFFPNLGRFVAAGDAVSRQSPEHGLIVWDVDTGAKLSNQIFHERYSCPGVRAHPSGSAFLAQTNGNYIARFKSQSPFSLDRYIRYEEHHVEGYPVGFDLSPDGAIIASGSSDGTIVCYKYTNAKILKKIPLPSPTRKLQARGCDEDNAAVVSVQWHPVLPSMLAASDWSGRLHILR